MRRLMTVLLGVYLFIYVFAVPMLLLDLVPSWGTWMGGFLNILQGSLVALWLQANAGWRGGLAACCIAGLSFAVEHIGVTTGVPFGRYSYSEVLGFKVGGDVPLPIPFAWLLVVAGAIGAARLLGVGRRWLLLAAPLLVLFFDLLLEPFAVYTMGYWLWIESGPYYGVPTANFVAWAGTGLVLSAITLALTSRTPEPHALPFIPALLYVLNIVQFTLVDLVEGYTLAGLLGLAGLFAAALHLAINADRSPLTAWLRASGWRTSPRAEPES